MAPAHAYRSVELWEVAMKLVVVVAIRGVLVFVLLGGTVEATDAQLRPVTVVLDDFEVGAEAGVDSHGFAEVVEAIHFADRFSAARVDSILDGLGALASSAPSAAARTKAIIWLYIAGRADNDFGFSGVVRRLGSAYRTAEARGQTDGHRILLLGMAQQAERAEALEFLEWVVVETANRHAFSMAFSTLLGMSPEGREVLDRLYTDERLTESWKRGTVRRLIEDGFPPGY